MSDESQLQKYLRDKISFSVVINYLETKKSKFVVFKPYINVQSTKEKYIKILQKSLGLEKTNIINTNDTYKLAIQHYDDIDSAIKAIDDYDFFEDSKKESFNKFKQVYALIRRLKKTTQTEWNDLFIDIINGRIEINNNKRIVETPKKTIERIRKFLE